MEINHAYDASKKCKRCCEHVQNIDNFLEFRKVIRDLRSDLTFYVYTDPVRSLFPDVLIGNYGVNPHDGYRYWYDFLNTMSTVSRASLISGQNTENGIMISQVPVIHKRCRLPIPVTEITTGMISIILITGGFTVCFLLRTTPERILLTISLLFVLFTGIPAMYPEIPILR